MRLDESLELVVVHHAGVARHFFAFLEDQEAGNRHDAELGCFVRVVLAVVLDHAERTRLFLGELVHSRAHCAARTAPRSPKVDQDWGWAFENFRLEGCVSDFGGVGHDVQPDYRTGLLLSDEFFDLGIGLSGLAVEIIVEVVELQGTGVLHAAHGDIGEGGNLLEVNLLLLRELE
jgi:hypothetical protein